MFLSFKKVNYLVAIMVFEYLCIKKRLLVPDLVMCYSKDAQHECIKLSSEVT